jgi:hypothetical protein
MSYVLPKPFQLSPDSNLSLWDISLEMLELTLLQDIWKEIKKIERKKEKKPGVLFKIKK